MSLPSLNNISVFDWCDTTVDPIRMMSDEILIHRIYLGAISCVYSYPIVVASIDQEIYSAWLFQMMQ
jgi:hypothetical protein